VIRYSVFIFGLIFAAEIPAADLSGEEILRRSVAGEARQQKLRQQYTWHEHQETGPARADGSPVKVNIARDFDVIFLEGSFYRKLVAINGKPLNSKQGREEEEKMHTTAAQRMARPLAKRARRSGVPLSDILSVMDHRLLREEEVGGHKCWVCAIRAEKRHHREIADRNRGALVSLYPLDRRRRKSCSPQRVGSNRPRRGNQTRFAHESRLREKQRFSLVARSRGIPDNHG
jgi:hypothetical protein